LIPNCGRIIVKLLTSLLLKLSLLLGNHVGEIRRVPSSPAA
jgi:hypothetical protein